MGGLAHAPPSRVLNSTRPSLGACVGAVTGVSWQHRHRGSNGVTWSLDGNKVGRHANVQRAGVQERVCQRMRANARTRRRRLSALVYAGRVAELRNLDE
jgi:hypothetical protein